MRVPWVSKGWKTRAGFAEELKNQDKREQGVASRLRLLITPLWSMGSVGSTASGTLLQHPAGWQPGRGRSQQQLCAVHHHSPFTWPRQLPSTEGLIEPKIPEISQFALQIPCSLFPSWSMSLSSKSGIPSVVALSLLFSIQQEKAAMWTGVKAPNPHKSTFSASLILAKLPGTFQNYIQAWKQGSNCLFKQLLIQSLPAN